MSRLFNGTSDKATCVPDLSAYSLISVAYWLWNDGNGSAERAVLGYSPVSAAGTFLIESRYTSAVAAVTMATTSSKFWIDTFPQPSAAAWHHYVFVLNRATPLSTVYVDGVLQTLTGVRHDAAAYGNFANGTWQMMNYPANSWFWAGRMAELAAWGGIALTLAQAKALYAGAFPLSVNTDSLKFYAPLLGDSPEPDYSGRAHPVSLTGTTNAAHPPVRSFLRAA